MLSMALPKSTQYTRVFRSELPSQGFRLVQSWIQHDSTECIPSAPGLLALEGPRSRTVLDRNLQVSPRCPGCVERTGWSVHGWMVDRGWWMVFPEAETRGLDDLPEWQKYAEMSEGATTLLGAPGLSY